MPNQELLCLAIKIKVNFNVSRNHNTYNKLLQRNDEDSRELLTSSAYTSTVYRGVDWQKKKTLGGELWQWIHDE